MTKLSLTPQFFAIYGLIQVIGVMSFVFPWIAALWLALTLLVIAFAIVDKTKMPKPADFAIEAVAPRDPRIGAPTELVVKLRILGRKVFNLSEVRILAPPIPLFHFNSRKIKIDMRRDRSHEYDLKFEKLDIRELGYWRTTTWPMAITSRLGFFHQSFQLEIPPIEFRVSPERKKLDEQAFHEIIQTQKILMQGSRQILKSRAAEQFQSIRKYQFPDSLRHIDHKKTARYNEPMTRVFEAQHNHHLILALDTGRAVYGEIKGSRKSDYYVSAALALAENAVRSRDKVSLFSFAGRKRFEIRSARSFASFLPLYRGAKEFSPTDLESDYSLVPKTISRITGTRSIVVVLTDLSKPSVQEALIEALGPLCRKHLVIAVGLNDPENDVEEKILAFDASSGKFKDVSTFRKFYADLLYGYWASEKELLFRDRFARLGGSSLTVNDSDWISAVEKLYQVLRNSQMV